MSEHNETAAPDVAGKTCGKCGTPKPEIAFPKLNGQRRRSICTTCHNEKRRSRGDSARRRAAEAPGEARWRAISERYGITRDQYIALLDAQAGTCAICKRVPQAGKSLAVDHCHSTGVVRALLCTRCNVIVGIYENHRQTAAAYLSTYAAGNPLLKP
ncbi:endonuclease domain-containing protein [Streptomyces sp. NPDC054887]